MYSTFFTVALFLAPALQGVLADFAVNNPTLVQCQDAKVSWQPTTGPYNVYAVNPDDPCGPEIAHLGQFTDTFYDFKTPFPAGMKVQMYIEDNAGDEAWSQPITVGASNDASCVLPTLVASGSGSSSSAASSSQTPAANAGGSNAAATVKPSPSQSVAPIGAANAGNNPLGINAAPSSRQVTVPVVALSAVAALAAYMF